MMARYKSKIGASEAPRGTPASGVSRPIATRHTGRVEDDLTHWKQRAAAHSTRHTFGVPTSPNFSQVTNLWRGFAVAFVTGYNKTVRQCNGRQPPPNRY